MQNLQEVFLRIRETKKKQKDIKSSYREALMGSQEYKEIKEKMDTLRARKKQLETTIKSDFSGEFTKLDDMQIDLESDNVLLSDISMTKLMKGETVEVEDEYSNKYEPLFTVKFKKT